MNSMRLKDWVTWSRDEISVVGIGMWVLHRKVRSVITSENDVEEDDNKAEVVEDEVEDVCDNEDEDCLISSELLFVIRRILVAR